MSTMRMMVLIAILGVSAAAAWSQPIQGRIGVGVITVAPGVDAPPPAGAGDLAQKFKQGNLLFTATVKEAKAIAQTNGIPPSTLMEITFQDLKVLRGKEPGKSVFNFSTRDAEQAVLAAGAKVIVAGNEAGESRTIAAIVEATAENMKAAQAAGEGAATTRPAATRPALTPAQEKAAGELMKQLGADDYATRENATKKLIELGEPVQPVAKAKLQEKDLDPEIAHRLGLVIKATTPVQEGTEVTDEATGITVSIIQPGGTIVQGMKDGQVLWQSGYGVVTSLRLKDGQLTILPRGFILDLTTGRMLGRAIIKG